MGRRTLPGAVVPETRDWQRTTFGPYSKRILRSAMAGTVPGKILNRRDKMGFVTPEENWVRHAQPSGFRAALHHAVWSADIAPHGIQPRFGGVPSTPGDSRRADFIA